MWQKNQTAEGNPDNYENRQTCMDTHTDRKIYFRTDTNKDTWIIKPDNRGNSISGTQTNRLQDRRIHEQTSWQWGSDFHVRPTNKGGPWCKHIYICCAAELKTKGRREAVGRSIVVHLLVHLGQLHCLPQHRRQRVSAHVLILVNTQHRYTTAPRRPDVRRSTF